MKYKPLIISALSAVLLFSSCSDNTAAPAADTADKTNAVSAEEEKQASLLRETPDSGQEYIDSFIFIGESTTYHMKSRGVLSGGSSTKQVWAPKSGTATLDAAIKTLKIVYPETGEEIRIGEAVKRKKPKFVLLTFGLNGAVQKVKAGKDYFHTCYLYLINDIRTNSPETKIILQSCFPVSAEMDMSNYSVDVETLMSHITLINSWTLELAENEGLNYLNTIEVLTNSEGYLRQEYDVGDGYHLTTEAYIKILEYIRTHKYTENI